MNADDVPLLAVRGLRASYGKIEALKGIDLEIRRGEIVTLIGANGAGKSTLMMTIFGRPRAKAGRIEFDGLDITGAGTDRALAATAEGELITVPAFRNGPDQLWAVQQLTDGTYRIMPKKMPNSSQSVALTAIGASSPALIKFDPKNDKAKWSFRKP